MPHGSRQGTSGILIPGCPAHRALIHSVLEGDPDDAALERYASEVPVCDACQRELSVSLRTHPARLQAPPPRPAADQVGMMALLRELRLAPVSVTRWNPRRWVVAGMLAAAAVLLLFAVWDGPVEQSPTAIVAMPAVRPVVQPEPHAAELTHPDPLPSPKREIVASPPQLPSQTRLPPQLAPTPVAPPESADAVAVAEDWPAPDFEDLRSGAAKSVVPSVRAMQLVLVGQPGYVVGEGVDLVVVASHDTPITICVNGPERGTIWRGAVPAGRTTLTRGGQQQAFAFAAPGTYRFSLSSGGTPGCREPLHVVEVEVDP